MIDRYRRVSARLHGPLHVVAVAIVLVGMPARSEAQAPRPSDVPIGTVLDWWRPDPSWPVPDGYQICDGSVVSDASSPLLGKSLPDLRSRFVMGVADPGQIGVSGGAPDHDHSVDVSHTHASVETSSAGVHTHAVDLPPLSVSVTSGWSGAHSHEWLQSYLNPADGKLQFWSYRSDGASELMGVWSNGINDEGSGIYPITIARESAAFFTVSAGAHQHSVPVSHDHPAVSSASKGDHAHKVPAIALSTSFRTTKMAGNMPPYIGLLKIMRIR